MFACRKERISAECRFADGRRVAVDFFAPFFRKKGRFDMYENWKIQTGKFLTAQTISLFGSALVQYAMVWYLTLYTGSGKVLTLSTICGFLPQVLISLFAGTWLDRYNRKKLMMISDGMIAFVTGILGISFSMGKATTAGVIMVLAMRSVGSGIQTPATQAVIPQLVPKEALVQVNGIQSTSSAINNFLAPAASGAVLGILGIEATLFLDVITAVMGISITSTIMIPELKAKTEVSSWIQMVEGVGYIKKNQDVCYLLFFEFVTMFFVTPSAFLTPLLVSRSFGKEVWRLTCSEMTYSLGMILGGLLLAVWKGYPRRAKAALLTGTWYGMLMFGLGLAPTFGVYLLCNTLIGIASPCYNAPMTAFLQDRVPQEYHGRVFGFLQIAMSMAFPLGMLIFGPVADVMKISSLLFIGGSGVLGVMAYSFFRKKLNF